MSESGASATGMRPVAPRVEPVVALDVATAGDALALVDRLGPACGFYKVGLELFTAAGPAVVEALRARGLDVFLDLKLHDIPNTVAGAARSAARLGVRLLTVHASGGEAMLRAAVDGFGAHADRGGVDGGATGGAAAGHGVLAVTVLASLDAGAVAAAWGRPPVDVRVEVLRLADLAAAAGAHGVVCSGAEAGAVRERHGSRLSTLVPGVRLTGDGAGDQSRVVTPAAAAAAGARYVVLGRTVTAAADPVAALARARAELADGGAGA